MRQSAASQKDLNEKALIRWLALALAVGFWVLGIVFGQILGGKTLQQANSDAAAGAIAGLIAWTVYHIVSRRNDGSGIFMLALAPEMHTGSLGFWQTFGISLVAGVPYAWLFARWSMWYFSKAERSASRATDAMYDADIDGQPEVKVP